MSRPATHEPLDNLIFRPLAARLVGLLERTPVTANQVSVAGALAGALAAACLVHGGLVAAAGAPLLLFLSLVLDVADGQLARARGQRSHAGWVMDILADGSKGVMVFGALALALGRAHGPAGVAWGVAAAVSVLAQVLARDHSLHRFEHDTDPRREPEESRLARIDAERRSLRAGPLTLGRVAIAVHDAALRIAAPLLAPRPARDGGYLSQDERERRGAAQSVWRHLGGTAQLATVALGAATGRLLPAAAAVVVAGNSVLLLAALLEWRYSRPLSASASAQSRPSGTSSRR